MVEEQNESVPEMVGVGTGFTIIMIGDETTVSVVLQFAVEIILQTMVS